MPEIPGLQQRLDELKIAIDKLPKDPKKRLNIIEIAGYPSWENVVSNFLAFYFSDHDHLFGRNLFNAFLAIIERKVELPKETREAMDFTMNYSVERETDYIDILITSDEKDKNNNHEWAIIVENKVHAQLYNDLAKYWNIVPARNKIGVVLSLTSVEQQLKALPGNMCFVNILYPELIAEWKEVLKDFFLESDDRHLLYLKDFIQNIESFYKSTHMEENQIAKLQLFQKNMELIESINNLQSEAQAYMIESSIQVMAAFEFYPYTPYLNVNSKHFYPDEALVNKFPAAKFFRFWFSYTELTKRNKLELYLELHGEACKYEKKFRERVKAEIPIENLQIKIDAVGNEKSGFCHIFGVMGFDLAPYIENRKFADGLEEFIRNNFFDATDPVTAKCFSILDETMK